MKALALSAALLVLLTSCEKETEEPTPTPYVPEYTLWTIPKDDSQIRVFVNGEAVEIRHDMEYPHGGYVPPPYNAGSVYYPVTIALHRNDMLRVEADGRHEVLLATSTIANLNGDTLEYVVFPQ